MHAEGTERTSEIATELMALLGTGQQVAPFSSRYGDFGFSDAYAVVAALRDLRVARAETPVGRKIGFTNRAIWDAQGIAAPMWSYMFDSTVRDLAVEHPVFSLSGLAEPRIEPEIVLHLAGSPHADMPDDELLGCIDWIAHGFEIVHSVFPGWRFAAADAAAAYGLHGALLLGDRRPIADDPARWGRALTDFTIEFASSEGASRHGKAQNVLGGPLHALRFLMQELVRFPASEPLRAGELITTGTLTEAMPAVAGDSWTTTLTGIDLPGAQVELV